MNPIRPSYVRPWTLLALALTVAISMASCGKDDSNPIAPSAPAALEKTPITKAFFLDSTFTVTSSGSGTYEYGPKFSVLRAGSVVRLAVKMPVADTFRVTLWGNLATTPSVLASTNIVQRAVGKTTYADITPVALSTGQQYQVTIRSRTAWYNITPTIGGSISYPVVNGSVSVEGYNWHSATWAGSPVYPTNVDNTYQAGFVDFDFQPS